MGFAMPAALQQELGQILMLVAADFQHRLDADLASRGISGVRARHRSVFLHLGRFGPSRSVDLAEAAGIRPQSMMIIVRELEEMGLVVRHPDPADSRAKLVDFSDQGRHFIVELGLSTQTVWQQYASQLDEQTLTTTIRNLQQLITPSREETT